MAQNNSTVNYIKLAYLQRLSLRLTNPELPYALVTDEVSARQLTDQQREQFDHVIELPFDFATNQEWKQANDWQLGMLTPFRETIKVESDLLFTHNINHWWPILSHQEVVLALGCRNFQNQKSTSRAYRKLFDQNNLPDVYSGLMYWRNTHFSQNFFAHCSAIYKNWESIKPTLIQCSDPGSNDVVFAIACVMLGVDKTTLPAADFFNFVHLKPAHNFGMNAIDMNIEFNPPSIRINAVEQQGCVHYYHKQVATDSLIEKYERTIRI